MIITLNPQEVRLLEEAKDRLREPHKHRGTQLIEGWDFYNDMCHTVDDLAQYGLVSVENLPDGMGSKRAVTITLTGQRFLLLHQSQNPEYLVHPLTPNKIIDQGIHWVVNFKSWEQVGTCVETVRELQSLIGRIQNLS